MKRIFDLVLAVIGLVIAAPVMALIAVAIRLDTPGRVIFSQKRLGRHGRAFMIHKFRKFPDDWGTKGSGVTVAGDVRMTRFGRFLERSKLDELPQLWNIIKGDMSFVGPRPESLDFADLFTGEFERVHDYKPGIFGPNQVAYRNEAEMYPPDRNPDEFYRSELFPAKARNDLDYFDRATLLTDIVWIVRGVWVSLIEAVNWKRLIRQRGIHMGYDSGALAAGWVIGTLLRFDGIPFGNHLNVFIHGLWLLPVVVIPMMFIFGSYRQPVRHFSLAAAARIGGTVMTGFVLVALVVLALINRNASMMVFPIATAASFLLMVAGRVYYRERWRRENHSNRVRSSTQRIAIYGAGRRGAALADLLENGFAEAEVVGFIDDNDQDMRGREIAGRRVLGSERDLGTIHARYALDQIWTTFVPGALKRRRLDEWCQDHAVELVVLPRSEPFRGLLAAQGHATALQPPITAQCATGQLNPLKANVD